MTARRERLFLLGAALGVGAALGIAPRDRSAWATELIVPALEIIACVVAARWFVFTPLAYRLVFAHVLVQLWGGHFTYGQEPIFAWLQDAWGLARNHYDRLAHFAVGLLLFVPIREVILRAARVTRGWACFFAIAVVGAVAGWWELFEWGVVAAQPGLTEAYLGTQGDAWDAQKDMLMALAGALAAWPLLTRAHDRQLAAAGDGPQTGPVGV